MTLYLQNQQTSVTWPEPFESTWQLLGGTYAHDLAPKLPHLGLADILFMTTIMSLPRQQRPWGIATWMSEVFALSRPGMYGLTNRVRQRLLPTTEPIALPAPETQAATVSITPTRLARTVLTASLPGKMAIRPLRQALNEAFDQTRDGSQVLRDLERAAFRATKQVVKLEKQLLKEWDETLFDEKYVPAVMKEELRYDQHAAFAEWLAHFVDALELVDWRSGEIRDRPINEWLFEETLTTMSVIDHPRVQKWVKTLCRHQSQLLTSLDWLATSLQPYRAQLAEIVPDDQQESFMQIVAQHWRLQQALINGQRSFRQHAQEAVIAFESLIANFI